MCVCGCGTGAAHGAVAGAGAGAGAAAPPLPGAATKKTGSISKVWLEECCRYKSTTSRFRYLCVKPH